MKRQIIAWCSFLGGSLLASYLCWAFHRTTIAGLIDGAHQWPRPFPYPDRWLGWWEPKLDAAHPVSPGFIKLDGEWQRLQIYLAGMIILAAIVTLCGLIWLLILRRRTVD